MSDWTSGYVADLSYTYGYYSELNPQRIKHLFLHAGLQYPKITSVCELGFGQGISINLHAAASPIAWHGTDFNPAQAAFAQELAEASGAEISVYDDDFSSFAKREELPDFDFIGLHGIWSWINDENRTALVDFIRRKLKAGGVLYISYNTLPGWGSFAPMRHLMAEHAEIMGAHGSGIVTRIDEALAFSESLLALNPIFSRANPQIAERMKNIKDQNRRYLAHEYFNRDWHPMYFSTLANRLASAKLTYACSANPLDHVDVINLTDEQQQFLKSIPDDVFRETVRDFMTNQQFRRDYWVKGTRRLAVPEQNELIRRMRMVLVAHRADVSLQVKGALGEAGLSEAVYNPLLDYMADHKVKTIGEIEQYMRGKSINFLQVKQACMVLMGTGQMAVAQDEAEIQTAKKMTDRLNGYIMQKAMGNGEINYLASPVTGGGISVSRFQQLFLAALQKSKRTPTECAQVVWQLLSVQGQKIIKEGKTLGSEEENIRELTEQATVFMEKQWPILKALQIA